MSVFSHIQTCVEALDEIFNTASNINDMPIHYYKKMVTSKNLTDSHRLKIVESWTAFCKTNMQDIKDKVCKNMKRIEFLTGADSKNSDSKLEGKIYIDFVDIFSRASKLDYNEGTTEYVNTIWDHLLVISATANPTTDSVEILKQVQDNEKKMEDAMKTLAVKNNTSDINPNDVKNLHDKFKGSTDKGDVMLSKMLESLEKAGPNANPMSTLLSSGILNMDTDDVDPEQLLMKLALMARAFKNK